FRSGHGRKVVTTRHFPSNHRRNPDANKIYLEVDWMHVKSFGALWNSRFVLLKIGSKWCACSDITIVI
ncbi:hypothetical protein NPIL_492251, partial [Nephila pilipes]